MVKVEGVGVVGVVVQVDTGEGVCVGGVDGVDDALVEVLLLHDGDEPVEVNLAVAPRKVDHKLEARLDAIFTLFFAGFGFLDLDAGDKTHHVFRSELSVGFFDGGCGTNAQGEGEDAVVVNQGLGIPEHVVEGGALEKEVEGQLAVVSVSISVSVSVTVSFKVSIGVSVGFKVSIVGVGVGVVVVVVVVHLSVLVVERVGGGVLVVVRLFS